MADFVAQYIGSFAFTQSFAAPDDHPAQYFPPLDATDTVVPVATLVSPALGDITPSTPIVLDVEDDRELKRVTIWVEYPNLGTDVIYARGQFMPGYSTSTEQTLIADPKIRKKRFTLVKQGGWPEPPYIWAEGTDPGGSVS